MAKAATTRTGLRCAIYLRVSTKKQADDGYGLDVQRRETRAKATQQGYRVIGEFVDGVERDASGAKDDRAAFRQVRELVRQRAVDVILTGRNDRFWRSAGEHLYFVKTLRDHGVQHDYVGWTPEDTKESRLQETILAGIAEYQREVILDLTYHGTMEKARKGLSPVGPAPFGYRRDAQALGGLAVDPAQAAIVKRIFTWAAEGVSFKGIARRLDTQGIPSRRGTRWSRTGIRHIVNANVYLGTGVYNRTDRRGDHAVVRDPSEWITYPVTPIISPALAERARAHIERNKRLLRGRPARRLYLLGGLLTCGRCGRPLHGNTRTTPIYRCAGATEPDRCNVTLPAADVEACVWATVRAIIEDPATLRSEAKGLQLGIDARRVDAASECADLAQALTKATQARGRLLDLYTAGRIDTADLDQREPALKAEIARLTQARAEAQARLDAGQADRDRLAALTKTCRMLARGIDRLDDAQRQALVRKVLTRIVVHADRVELEGVFQLTVPTEPHPEPRASRGGEKISPARSTSTAAPARARGAWQAGTACPRRGRRGWRSTRRGTCRPPARASGCDRSGFSPGTPACASRRARCPSRRART
jgi:site-specific DNA recombinase